jgi:hypothetical protein
LSGPDGGPVKVQEIGFFPAEMDEAD